MVFNGSIQSDFLKLVNTPDAKKVDFVDFAATDFLTLRDALIKYMQAVYPLDYQNFAESDLGMMFIETVAYMGAVMSMKADMLANENFLATARNRNNVKKLLELIGVKMRGPVAAVANAKLTLDSATTLDPIVIEPGSRVFTVTSPEDGKPLNFTLYKTVQGAVDDPSNNGDINLSLGESENQASSVWTNLVLLEGSLVTQTGSFTSNDLVKTIKLSVNPVIERSVQIYITTTDASGAWTQVDSLFFASGGSENIFEVSYDDDYYATIIFGDGRFGRNPPPGADYIITYRVGGGNRGNIRADFLNVVLTTQDGQTGVVENTTIATGGRDAETVEEAKKYAPYTFKRQDRLVTAEDYSTFANSFIGSTGSTGKARAVVRQAYSSANIIDLFLLEVATPYQLQQATINFKRNLLESIEEKKMLTDEVVIVDGLIRTLDLILTIRIDRQLLPKEEEVKAKVRRRVLAFFSVNNFDFGKPLVLGDLTRSVFTLPEVRFATVDNLDTDIYVEFNEIIQLNNLTINVVAV